MDHYSSEAPDKIPPLSGNDELTETRETARDRTGEDNNRTTQPLIAEAAEQDRQPEILETYTPSPRERSSVLKPPDDSQNDEEATDNREPTEQSSSKWGIFRLRPDEDDEPQYVYDEATVLASAMLTNSLETGGLPP